ncbi:MAG TPA: ABA4-like family protein [Pyrinomonadaceae bacterium]|nr:ABA4-like family protein [Pyrinomonadaceae bacterium]
METLFKLSGLLVLPFWALMIFLPRWRVTRRLMSSPFVAAAPAVIYAALVVPRLGEVWRAVSSPELYGVAALLGSPAGATIAWLHFLAFDLFVGRWAYLDGRERGVSAWLMAPVLFLTLMLGPFGFLLYLVVRSAAGGFPARAGAARVSSASE